MGSIGVFEMKAVPAQNSDMMALGVGLAVVAVVLSLASVAVRLPVVQTLIADVVNYIWSQVRCGLPPEAPFR
jgi:hypothetical protein